MKRHKVLFVDDEPHILSAIKRALLPKEYHLLFCTNAKDALATMAQNEIAVIVADMKMPDCSGLVLLQEVKERYPLTVQIVLSGYLQLTQVLATVNSANIFRYLTKPFGEEELHQVITQALDLYQILLNDKRLKDELKKRNISYQNIFRIMDQKVRLNLDDLNRIIQINQTFFHYLTQKLTKEEMEKTNPLLKILHAFTRSLPSEIEHLSVEKIKQDLEKKRPDIQVHITTKKRISLNYPFFLFLQERILDHIKVKEEGITLNIVEKKERGTVVLMSLLVEEIQDLHYLEMTLASFMNITYEWEREREEMIGFHLFFPVEK